MRKEIAELYLHKPDGSFTKVDASMDTVRQIMDDIKQYKEAYPELAGYPMICSLTIDTPNGPLEVDVTDITAEVIYTPNIHSKN